MEWKRVTALPKSKDLPDGIGLRVVMKGIRSGQLKAAQVGGRKVWVTSDVWLREWIESQVVKAGK